MKLLFPMIFILFLISACAITEENIEDVAVKMQEAYDGISTLEVREDHTSITKGIRSTNSYNKYVDKINNNKKVEFLSGFQVDAGKVANIWVGSDFYDERNDKVYKYSCSSNVFDEPDFVDELRSILKKWSSIVLIGTEAIGGKEAYKIRLGDESEGHYLWVDRETYLPLKEVFPGRYEKEYSNYFINAGISSDIFSPSTTKKIIEQSCDEEEEVSESEESVSEEESLTGYEEDVRSN